MIKNKTTLIGLGVIILSLLSLFLFNFECMSNASCTEEELGLSQKFLFPIAMIIGAAIFSNLWCFSTKETDISGGK